METHNQAHSPACTLKRRLSLVLSFPLVWLMLAVIKGYRFFVSPLIGQNCRFYPSCSAYAEEALTHHGLIRGCWLSTKRIASCHPWHAGGYDPVPQPKNTPKP